MKVAFNNFFHIQRSFILRLICFYTLPPTDQRAFPILWLSLMGHSDRKAVSNEYRVCRKPQTSPSFHLGNRWHFLSSAGISQPCRFVAVPAENVWDAKVHVNGGGCYGLIQCPKSTPHPPPPLITVFLLSSLSVGPLFGDQPSCFCANISEAAS